jgi:hypothetical protein
MSCLPHTFVVPAKAGTQRLCGASKSLDSRLRGNDGCPMESLA